MRTANAEFKSPHAWSNRVLRGVWNIVYFVAYRWTPPRLGGPYRRLVLRCFGAQLGQTWIHPSTRIWAPWLLKSGDDVFVDRDCYLYNPYGIEIGNRVIISFETILCTPSHDHCRASYPLIGGAIRIEDDCWLTARVFVHPGVTIGQGVVAGACSVLTRDVSSWTIVAGNPAREIGKRKIALADESVVHVP